jgi:hypothetical protein
VSDSTVLFVILGAIVVLFVTNRVPVAIIAIATALSLWATGILDLEQATAGFGDPTVLLIASLFVVRGPRRHRRHRVGRSDAGRPRRS